MNTGQWQIRCEAVGLVHSAIKPAINQCYYPCWALFADKNPCSFFCAMIHIIFMQGLTQWIMSFSAQLGPLCSKINVHKVKAVINYLLGNCRNDALSCLWFEIVKTTL